jgi:hypothetical protein
MYESGRPTTGRRRLLSRAVRPAIRRGAVLRAEDDNAGWCGWFGDGCGRHEKPGGLEGPPGDANIFVRMKCPQVERIRLVRPFARRQRSTVSPDVWQSGHSPGTDDFRWRTRVLPRGINAMRTGFRISSLVGRSVRRPVHDSCRPRCFEF